MKEIVEFQAPVPGSWTIVNDGVMGGRSSSSFELTGDGTATFRGFVSLENNGGFASVRGRFQTLDLSAFGGIVLKVKGDGRTYDLRLRTDRSFDGIAHRAQFTPPAGTWTEIYLPFDEFRPTFRGRTPRGVNTLDPSEVRQVGFLIGDKREGPFELEVAWIRAVSEAVLKEAH